MKKTIMDTLKDKIKENKYKFTTQRKYILQAFVISAQRHLSAEDVFREVRVINPDVGLATVYRTLELFTELNLLQKVDFGDGRSRYELNDRGVGHFHHHLICLNCGSIKEFNYDMLEPLEKSVKERLNFTVTDHQLKLYGYCNHCENTNKNK